MRKLKRISAAIKHSIVISGDIIGRDGMRFSEPQRGVTTTRFFSLFICMPISFDLCAGQKEPCRLNRDALSEGFSFGQ